MNIIRNWTVHNMIAHPLMHILNLLGMTSAAILVHDGTLPFEDI